MRLSERAIECAWMRWANRLEFYGVACAFGWPNPESLRDEAREYALRAAWVAFRRGVR